MPLEDTHLPTRSVSGAPKSLEKRWVIAAAALGVLMLVNPGKQSPSVDMRPFAQSTASQPVRESSTSLWGESEHSPLSLRDSISTMLMSGDMTGVAQSISCSTAEEQAEIFSSGYSFLFVRENLHLFTKLSLKDFWNLDFEGMSTSEILHTLEIHGRYTPEQVRGSIQDIDIFKKYSISPTSSEYERLFMSSISHHVYLSPPLDEHLNKYQSEINLSVWIKEFLWLIDSGNNGQNIQGLVSRRWEAISTLVQDYPEMASYIREEVVLYFRAFFPEWDGTAASLLREMDKQSKSTPIVEKFFSHKIYRLLPEEYKEVFQEYIGDNYVQSNSQLSFTTLKDLGLEDLKWAYLEKQTIYELLGDPAIRAEIKDWRPYIEKELRRDPLRLHRYNRMLDYYGLLGLTTSDIERMQRAWEIEKESKEREGYQRYRNYFNEKNAYYLLSKLQSSWSAIWVSCVDTSKK